MEVCLPEKGIANARGTPFMFTNFIEELNNLLNISVFQRDEPKYIELSKAIAEITQKILSQFLAN